MKIKDYRCGKCGSTDFKTIKKGLHTGLYCTHCGKFYKWLSKDERNLVDMTEGATK